MVARREEVREGATQLRGVHKRASLPAGRLRARWGRYRSRSSCSRAPGGGPALGNGGLGVGLEVVRGEPVDGLLHPLLDPVAAAEPGGDAEA